MNLYVVLLLFVPVTVFGHYGRASSNYQYSPQHAEPFLNDNYVCSIQANYGLYGQHGKHFRQTTNYCQDAYKTGSCETCCTMAARIQGTNINENLIVGFNIVLKREPLCVCCAPNFV